MKLEKFININWFMERKPYANHTSYDSFYLKICRDLYTIVHNIVTENDKDINLDEEDFREMAYLFTGYFEDQVNNIGFWNALIALHKKQFGKRLPFFDKKIVEQQEEEFNDILPEDIHYLAYITLLNLLTDQEEKPVILFNSDLLIQLKEDIFAYLVEIEEVFTTDFYEKFLVPEQDYIEFKKQLDWFTYNSYLTSIEFTKRIDDHLEKLLDSNTDPSLLSLYLYSERDRLMSEIPSSFTAFFPADILAMAMRCDEKKKEEIRNLKWRAHGIFHIQQETETHVHFLHTSTGEEFDVLKASFNMPIKKAHQDHWITTIVRWDNDYYISGLCAPSPYKGEELHRTNLKMQYTFQKHFSGYRNSILELAREYRETAVTYFGNEFVIFDSGFLLQKKMNEFHAWHHSTVADLSNFSQKPEPVKLNLPEELLRTEGVALFIPLDGFQFILNHKQLMHLLEAPRIEKLTREAVEDTMGMLTDDSIGIDYWFYIKKHFPITNLSLLLKCPLDSDEDFEALLRICLPEDFSPLKLPRFTTSK
jgi:hypothetical protein